MGITEVTVGQFREFVNATGYKTDAELSGKGGWKAGIATSWSEQNPDFKWSNPGYPIADDLPVTVVTYKDANEFCYWLSHRDGSRYRLPSEAEWEYACRAGSAEIYPFPIDLKDTYAWSSFNIKASLSPRPVGTRLPNALGLADTIGNVREWCLDWYGDTAYQTPYLEAPTGPNSGTLRAVRGACYIDKAGFLRSSKRGYLAPEQAINNQGFRVVLEGN
jgi:formylglycine-generating enzyme required for sulfatase activity